MKSAKVVILTAVAALAAHADFSYTTTQKGGPAAGNQSTKNYFKGQKMKADMGGTATIVDFDAQTFTNINNTSKTYSVTPFSELSNTLKNANVSANVDVKETGQKKTVNGYNARELVMTMSMDSPQAAQAGMKMQMEMDMWISSDVPGASEVKSFFEKNGSRFPWSAMTAGANPSLQNAMTEMQKKMASMGGVPVQQIVRMKAAGNEAQNAAMEKARAQLEQMSKGGGPGAAMAQQQLARMGGGGNGSLFEITTDSSDFSTSSIPDSVFEIPAGYQKTERK